MSSLLARGQQVEVNNNKMEIRAVIAHSFISRSIQQPATPPNQIPERSSSGTNSAKCTGEVIK